MRWRPTDDRCPECGFDWRCDRQEAIQIVSEAPSRAARAMEKVPFPMRQGTETWSASMYVWHLVDVLRIGTERLLTLALDPEAGIACWDENALAADRKYAQLSPVVGVEVLRSATRDWLAAAELVPPDAVAEHPELGTIGAVEIARRAAHEVHHHVGDIEGGQAR